MRKLLYRFFHYLAKKLEIVDQQKSDYQKLMDTLKELNNYTNSFLASLYNKLLEKKDEISDIKLVNDKLSFKYQKQEIKLESHNSKPAGEYQYIDFTIITRDSDGNIKNELIIEDLIIQTLINGQIQITNTNKSSVSGGGFLQTWKNNTDFISLHTTIDNFQDLFLVHLSNRLSK